MVKDAGSCFPEDKIVRVVLSTVWMDRLKAFRRLTPKEPATG
jgi:hypothetical protein